MVSVKRIADRELYRVYVAAVYDDGIQNDLGADAVHPSSWWKTWPIRPIFD